MRPIKYRFLAVGIIGLTVACSDIIEEDLAGFGVVLLAPQNDWVSVSNSVQFKWEAVPGADAYQLQIAWPNFISAAQFVLDTSIEHTEYTQVLDTGNFQWRVRAVNSSSQTGFYTRNIRVELTDDLTQQSVALLMPSGGLITAQTSRTFQWATLDAAESYHFELRSGSQSGSLVNSTTTSGDTVELNSINEGQFAWGVQASNSLPSNTEFSWRMITIDATAPSQPTLNMPLDNEILSNTTNAFSWTSGIDDISSTVDSLYITDNSDQSIVVATQLDQNSYSDSLGVGVYNWWVSTIDAAGNTASSVLREFTIQ